MTAPTAVPETLNPTTLASFASQEGPCITWIVPDHHPGATELTQEAELRRLVQSAQERITEVPAAHWPERIVVALEHLRESYSLNGEHREQGGPGLAACLSLTGFAAIHLAGATESVSIGSHPYLMPLIAPAFAAHDLFVLSLNTKQVRLYEYVNGRCQEVAIPAGVPTSVEASSHAHSGAEGENRTPAGPGAGKLAGIRFGTSGERESVRTQVERLSAQLDRGLRQLLGERPLLLMGVREEIAAYRRVAHYDYLLDTEVRGNVETLTLAQIAHHAKQAAEDEYRRLGEAVLAQFREMRDRARTSKDARDVLRAAAEGRVHQVCLRAGTELSGVMDTELDCAKLHHEDLLNAIAAETLKRGGEVYVLPQQSMDVTEPVCAILRY
ncbi:MAG: hypothetical protein WDO18_05205 [Acidobacteriota bacterium]